MSASWVIRQKATGVVVMETFNAALVGKLNKERYEAVPILEYLVSLNRAKGQAMSVPPDDADVVG